MSAMNERYSLFRNKLKKELLILDGSMGALLQKRNLPAGYAPDLWNLENPSVIEQVHREYFEAGADILITNTFGASRLRLKEYDAYGKLKEINAAAVRLARNVVGEKGFVAGDIGPCGDTIYPTGKLSFDEAASIFYEQSKALIDAEADAIIIETMFDSLDYKAALSGVRAASSKIPVIALMTFNTDGISDTGISPESTCAIAEGFHADVVGANCSVGPDAMVKVIERMKKISNLHIAAQPNAGMPKLKNGSTYFPLNADEMASYAEAFFKAGARILGGCCGTTPEYISHLRALRDLKQKDLLSYSEPHQKQRVLLSSRQSVVSLGLHDPFVMIGERINPTGRKKVSENIRNGNLEALLSDAHSQALAGSQLLDINVGVPLIDEPEMMKTVITQIQSSVETPLVIDSSYSSALLKGGEVYYGRPLLNSINAEEEKMEEILPIAKRVGGAIIALMTETEVPEKAVDRLRYGEKILNRLLSEGFNKNDIVFDVLSLTASAMQVGAIETLKVIDVIANEWGCATTFGLSNSSFGLPNRRFIHQSYLQMAIQRGLTSAIMNVLEKDIKVRINAAEIFRKRPNAVEDFLKDFSETITEGSASHPQNSNVSGATSEENVDPTLKMNLTPLKRDVYFSILDGKKDVVVEKCKEFIKETPEDSFDLFLNVMTPAIRQLGDLFGKRKRFIPHLVASAEAMKCAVEVLQPHMAKSNEGEKKKGTIIFATVKGDIHDIGKNICILMLKNFGFTVIDLGRNVAMETIFDAAKEHKAQIIALSALMTTTMAQMKLLVEENKKMGTPYKVLVGGAPVTKDFSNEIGADGQCDDVGSLVGETEKVLHSMGYQLI